MLRLSDEDWNRIRRHFPEQSIPLGRAGRLGGKLIRTIGLAHASAKVGLMNLGYNMKRLVYLERQPGRINASIA